MATSFQPLSGLQRPHAPRAAALAALAALLTLAWSAAPAQASTQTFIYTGAEQTFKVPGGVTSIHVVAIGGAGGTTNASGGAAAEVIGDVTVTPGQTLYVEVGGNGQNSGAGGFNGGAAGGAGGSPVAAGGGGASDVRTLPGPSLVTDSRLIVAGGGGGGGGTGLGEGPGAGGAAGNPGVASGAGNGGGGEGTQIAGGSGGTGIGVSNGGEGQLGLGGSGGESCGPGGGGGGGGGGYYGGGGGGPGCEVTGGGGGGGGSSLMPLGGSVALASLATPAQVEITYTLVPPSIAIVSPASGATYNQGQAVTASYSCTPPEGTTVETCEGPVANGSPIDTSTLGPHTFTVEAEDKDTAEATEEVTYTVVAPPSISITSPANGATYTQGQAVTAIYSCTPAGGTGVKTCAGPVANGGALDTSTLGPHTFTVNAEDTDGGKATHSVSYTVECPSPGGSSCLEPPPPALPNTILGSHPKKTIKTDKQKVKVKFTFSSSTAGATFKCKLDKGAFAPCASPKTYKVKLGKHTFSVEAVSAADADPTPASFPFKVKKKH